jgi:hypothetical protein
MLPRAISYRLSRKKWRNSHDVNRHWLSGELPGEIRAEWQMGCLERFRKNPARDGGLMPPRAAKPDKFTKSS